MILHHYYEPYHKYSAKSQLPTEGRQRHTGLSGLLLIPKATSSCCLGIRTQLTLDLTLDKLTSWLEKKLLRWTEIIFGAKDIYMLYSPLVHRIGIFFGPRHWHCFFFFFDWHCQKYFIHNYFLVFDGQDHQATQESFLEYQGSNPLSPWKDKNRS